MERMRDGEGGNKAYAVVIGINLSNVLKHANKFLNKQPMAMYSHWNKMNLKAGKQPSRQIEAIPFLHYVPPLPSRLFWSSLAPASLAVESLCDSSNEFLFLFKGHLTDA
jgi:hypothetical protein